MIEKREGEALFVWIRAHLSGLKRLNFDPTFKTPVHLLLRCLYSSSLILICNTGHCANERRGAQHAVSVFGHGNSDLHLSDMKY